MNRIFSSGSFFCVFVRGFYKAMLPELFRVLRPDRGVHRPCRGGGGLGFRVEVKSRA